MPDKERQYVKTGVTALILLLLIVILYVFLFRPEALGSLITVMFGMLLGAICAYFIYHSFSIVEEPLDLGPDEKVLIETNSTGTYVMFPKEVGGFVGDGPPVESNLYLTEKSIIAEPRDRGLYTVDGELVVFRLLIPYILRFGVERRLLSDYIRITYADPETNERDVLLFTGEETDSWMEHLSRLMT